MIFEMIRMWKVATNILYVWHWAYQTRHATTAGSQTFCRLNVLAYIPRNVDNKVIFLRGSACKHSWTVTWALNVFLDLSVSLWNGNLADMIQSTAWCKRWKSPTQLNFKRIRLHKIALYTAEEVYLHLIYS